MMCYTGVITKEYQDVTQLFVALSRLANEDALFVNDLEICFYTNNDTRNYITKVAQKYRIESFFNFNDFVSAYKIPEILQKSSILLIISKKSTQNGPNGIMTTKFFEYLGTNRPVLLTESDQGCLEQVLTETKAGKASRTVDDACVYIKEKYFEWKEKGYTVGTADEKIVRKYSRRVQSNQFIKILEDAIISKIISKN